LLVNLTLELTPRDYSKAAFSARAKSDEELKELKAKLVAIVESVALATGCKHKITNKWHYTGNISI
jgi:metal-dependent amidase/aminoacylase/carboxypeptidase family protein